MRVKKSLQVFVFFFALFGTAGARFVEAFRAVLWAAYSCRQLIFFFFRNRWAQLPVCVASSGLFQNWVCVVRITSSVGY